MTTLQAIITIAAVVPWNNGDIVLYLIIFPKEKNPPEFGQIFGTVLPGTGNRSLCDLLPKDVPASSITGAAGRLIAILFYRMGSINGKNTLLSIGGGTVLYMILVQTVFH